MFETVTVDQAIKRGLKMVNLPVQIIQFGIIALALFLYFTVQLPGWYWALIIPGVFVVPWIYWSFKITKWRLWAFENVRNVHELKERAVKEKLIWPDGSIFEKTEIRNAEEKRKWLELQAKFDEPDDESIS